MGLLNAISNDYRIDASILILLLVLIAYTMFILVFVLFLYLIAMRHFQNYEYHKHRKGTTTLATAIIVSMFANFIVKVGMYINLIADHTNEKFKLSEKTYIFFKNFDGKLNKTILDILIQVLEQSTYLVFLCYRQISPPHDCFRCFNRLPGEAKYSIYQYTKDES